MRPFEKKQDLSRRGYWLGVGLIVAAKVAASFFQQIYVWVGGAPIDDELMFRAAQAVSAGQWLGEYDWLTLSKHMLFPLWLALIHQLHLPYLVANQLLWCAAALAAARAFAPVVKSRWAQLGLFGGLAFLPTAMASFTLRVYRDSIFPALCLLFFAGVAGYALRCMEKTAWGWQLLAGLGLAGAWLCREDGYWLVPFALAGSGILLWFIWRRLDRHRLVRSLCLLLPFGVLGAGLGLFSWMNYTHYGVFTLSDFSSGSFSDAMGAMSRVEGDEFIPLVTVPYSARQKIYAQTDAMDCLEYWLEESPEVQTGYRKAELGDYGAGGYYWAVRKAAYLEGKYRTAQTAQEYWAQVAEEINHACDQGRLPAQGGRRSGTAPAIRGEYILPVVGEGLYSLWFCATFQDCQPYEALRSIGSPEELAVWENYLGSHANWAAQAGTDLPYYSPLQKLAYGALGLVRWLYALVLPLALVLGLVLFICRGMRLFKEGGTAQQYICWWLILGLVGMALLRAFMIAFMEVAAFNIGTYVMYLATVHPLLLLAAFLSIYTGWEVRPWQK